MKRLSVILSPTVQAQITAQVIWIAEDSVDNALAWEVRVRQAMRAIGDSPGLTVDEDATKRLGYEIRKVVFEGTYLIHFAVDKTADAVRIVNFRHGARLPRHGEP